MAKIKDWERVATKIVSTQHLANETKLSLTETWVIEKDIDYMRFLFSANYPRAGSPLRGISWMPGSLWFTCVDSTMSGIKRDSENNLYFELTVNYTGPPIPEDGGFDPDRLILPWHLPIANYATASEGIEEAATHLYDRKGNKRSFCTSAGTEILSTKQRNILGMSFKYNLPKWAFFEEHLITYKNKINKKEIKIAGRNYAEGTVKITNLSAEILQYEFGDSGGWEDYWSVSLNLSIDPLTWWRQFANVSTFFLPTSDVPSSPKKTMSQIWSTETIEKATAQSSARGSLVDYTGQKIYSLESKPRTAPETKTTKHFGTYDEMSMLNSSALQEVTEPLYLFPDTSLITVYLNEEWSWLGGIYRPNRFGNEVDATGGILPFDLKTGRQFLGTYFWDGAYDSRFGRWRPLVWDENGKLRVVTKHEQDLDEKLIHETFVEGYQSPIVDFEKLYIPTHRGMRWKETYGE